MEEEEEREMEGEREGGRREVKLDLRVSGQQHLSATHNMAMNWSLSQLPLPVKS